MAHLPGSLQHPDPPTLACGSRQHQDRRITWPTVAITRVHPAPAHTPDRRRLRQQQAPSSLHKQQQLRHTRLTCFAGIETQCSMT